MAKRHVNRVGDLESLFLRLEELVLANSGEDEFEEVFKLVIAKLWDEKVSAQPRFVTGGSHEETASSISGLLQEANRKWPGVLDEAGVEPALRPEHLHVCVEALAQHQIGGGGLEVMDSFFEFLVARAAKGSKGQYFTPRHVVELCIRMLDPQPDELVLDPACGSGGFLIQALLHARNHHRLSEKDLARYCEKNLWGFDIDSRAVRVAKTLMILAGDGSSNIIRLNSLLKPDTGLLFPTVSARSEDENNPAPALTVEDVTRSRLRHHKGFDVIVTNPPFAGEVREPQVLNSYSLSRNGRTERDVLFLERCLELLAPNGRMAIVLPHNKFAMGAFDYVRTWLLKKAKVMAVVGLGRNTFLPHTHQKASILFVQKRPAAAEGKAEDSIFFAISERDGKNSKGQLLTRSGASVGDSPWSRVDHDFQEIVDQYGVFCSGGNLAKAVG